MDAKNETTKEVALTYVILTRMNNTPIEMFLKYWLIPYKWRNGGAKRFSQSSARKGAKPGGKIISDVRGVILDKTLAAHFLIL
ncbi:hypothetical protein BH10BAC3_BH10BAC3_38360 [soil metagenome]